LLPAEADVPVPQAEQCLRALQSQPDVFGPDVAEVEWIETHISWLLLAGD
jgi:aminoglycoside phosphotransferase family enzyme